MRVATVLLVLAACVVGCRHPVQVCTNSRLRFGEPVNATVTAQIEAPDRGPLVQMVVDRGGRGEPPAEPTPRQPEAANQEAEVLMFTETRGRVTRADAVRLCRLSSQGARNLLERLVRRGALVPRGKGRGTYYELPDEDAG